MDQENPVKPYKRKGKKFNSEHCNDDMSFEDCEMAILRHAVDESEKIQGQKVANSEEVKKIIKILEDFLVRKKCICYGGTAINNILPKYAQFYNKDIEVPDYDFFSPNALEDAKELADIYYAEGYIEVEAKSGMHTGTFKVYVDFLSIADITFLEPSIFNAITKDAITIAGIKYAPPNFLRMSMYLELSRPAGDVSRWEKVAKRLNLLNKYHPYRKSMSTLSEKCSHIDFQRKMHQNMHESEKLYINARDSFIEQGAVFFGGYASKLYSRYLPKEHQRKLQKVPDFDVISEEPERCAMIVCERLRENGFKNVEEIKHDEIGEIIPERIEIKVGKDTVAYIYHPVACHNYNTIQIGTQEINIATIDTMLSFYLAFIYVDEFVFFKERILCMANYLFEVEHHNKLEQTGILKRYSVKCIGKQPTIEEIRAEKAEKYKELSQKRGTKEYEMWFLKYSPTGQSRIATQLPDELGQTLHKGKKEKPLSVAKDVEEEKKEESVEQTDEGNTSNKSRNKHRKSMKKSSAHHINMLGDILFGNIRKSHQHEKIEKSRTQKKHNSGQGTFEVKRTEPRSGSKRFLDSFPRISEADSEKNTPPTTNFKGHRRSPKKFANKRKDKGYLY